MKLAHRCPKCRKAIYVCRGYKLRLKDHLKRHPASVTYSPIAGLIATSRPYSLAEAMKGLR